MAAPDPTLLKKLREARRFLSHMMQCSRSTRLDDDEQFGHYLSGFLTPTRSVTKVLENRKHKARWGEWKAKRSVEERQLLKHMTEQRNFEVHRGGAEITQQVEEVPLSSIENPSPLHAAYAPYHGEPWSEARIGVKVYYLAIAGKRLNAIDACKQYVDLLEAAVQEM